MDDWNSLSNRLRLRAPGVDYTLAQQFVNDAWATMQAQREWSFRRNYGTFAPPALYNVGSASTNVAAGNPTLITGLGTTWTAQMVGQQIRIGGLLFPFYTIIGYLSPTQLLIDQPWSGVDVTNQSYQINQCYYPVPPDFGYMYAVISIKDGYRLWLNVTESDLAVLDPQRTNFGQTYCAVYRGYGPQYGGVIGPALPVTSPSDPAPISTTTLGYSYPANATYVVQVVTGGVTGTATYQWLRSGQTAFSLPQTTTDFPIDLSDGVQIYWPLNVNYVANDIFIINCTSMVSQASILYELWPAPSSGVCPTSTSAPQYLYPYIYVSKEYALTQQSPSLPPLIANRGEVLLEAALQKCAEFPGQDSEHPNPYYNLKQAVYHQTKLERMMEDLMRNDEEVGVSLIDYDSYPFYPAPWATGQWQQTHAPFLNG